MVRGWYGRWYGEGAKGVVWVVVWGWSCGGVGMGVVVWGWYGSGMGVVWRWWYWENGMGVDFLRAGVFWPFGPSTNGENRALHVCSRTKSRTHTYIQHRMIVVVMVVVVVVIVMVPLHR